MACENKNCGSCDCDTPKKGKTFDMAAKKHPEVPDTVELESAIVDEDEDTSEHAFGAILLGFMMAWFLSSFT